MVAVERGDELFVEFPPDFRFAETDEIYVCGSDVCVRGFQERLASAA